MGDTLTEELVKPEEQATAMLSLESVGVFLASEFAKAFIESVGCLFHVILFLLHRNAPYSPNKYPFPFLRPDYKHSHRNNLILILSLVQVYVKCFYRLIYLIASPEEI